VGEIGVEAMRTLVCAAMVSAASLAGCTQESVHPLGGGTSTSTSGGSSSSSGSGQPTTIVRQVFQRNPWGGPPNNLLVDGDFELSAAPGTGQYGWTVFTAAGLSATQIPLVSETGGTCRTGLRCANASKGQVLFGRGTAPANMATSHASVYGKPSTPPAPDANPAAVCSGLFNATIVLCDTTSILVGLKPALAPSDDGFCEYSADVPGSAVALCLYIDMKEDAIVDSATLLPTPSAAAKIAPFEEPLIDQQRLHAIGDYIRAHKRLDEPRPVPGVREDVR